MFFKQVRLHLIKIQDPYFQVAEEILEESVHRHRLSLAVLDILNHLQ